DRRRRPHAGGDRPEGRHRRRVPRGSWHMDFIYQLGGFVESDERMRVRFTNAEGAVEFAPSIARVTSKVRLERTVFGDDFETLARLTTTALPKLTIPSPS